MAFAPRHLRVLGTFVVLAAGVCVGAVDLYAQVPGTSGATGATAPAGLTEQLAPQPPAASGPAPATDPDSSGELDLVGQLIRTIVSLGVVVGLIYLLARFGLSRLPGMKGLTGAGRHLRVLERLPLDTRHALFVISYRDARTFLVGSGEGGLRLLSELTEPPASPPKTFAETLDRVAQARAPKEETHG